MVVYIAFVLSLLIVSIGTAEINLPCGPGEVTKPYTFTCTIRQDYNTILWKRNGVNIAICNTAGCNSASSTHIYDISVSDGKNTSTLKIVNVATQSSGTYSCEDASVPSTCDFRVYAKPENVVCQDPQLQTETNEVKVVCTSQNVYPSPKCHFSWVLNEIEKNTSNLKFENLPTTSSDGYFSVTCSLTLPIKNFILGTHKFQVKVYPNITGSDSDTVYGLNSSWTSPKSVVYPMPTLNCSETIVQEGKPLSCTCRDTANTFIFPTTTLFYGSVQVGSALQQVTGNVTANRNTEELFCKAQLPDGTNANKTYTIQVAYGPTSVSLRVFYNQTETSIISLCDRTRPVTVTVTCSVPVNNVRPDIIYQFYSNVTDTPAGPSTMSARNYTVTSGGMFYFLCTGINSRFPTMSATSTPKIIQVAGPPSTPVLEKFQNSGTYVIVAGNQLTVQEGLTRIRCRVEGGYPSVSRLLLECGSQTVNTSVDNNVYIDVNMTRHMDGSNCSCTATHSSSCYRNNSAIALLDVHYPVLPGSREGTELNVGAVVGGVVAGVFALAAAILLVVFLKRRGRLPNRGNEDRNADGMLSIPHKETKEDTPAHTQAPQNSQYEEIIDVQYDIPDKPVYYANQILSNIDGEEVQYENTVCAL